MLLEQFAHTYGQILCSKINALGPLLHRIFALKDIHTVRNLVFWSCLANKLEPWDTGNIIQQ